MTLPTPEIIARMTPMMRQYYSLKSQCPDAILFFRMGDFYEIFATDAEDVAPKLELVLTSRERGDQERVRFCGVPHHSARGYWLKLLKLNYRVAIADQTEDPTLAKGLVTRSITRILTPGCIDELEGLENDTPNYVAAAFEDPATRTWAFAVADISTGELRCGPAEDLNAIVQLVCQFTPRELLVRRFFRPAIEQALSAYPGTLLFSDLNEALLNDSKASANLLSTVLGMSPATPLLCSAFPAGEATVAAMLKHFTQLGFSLRSFLSVRHLKEPTTMGLSDTVVRDLELFETARRRQARGSLFHLINRCLTPMGMRLLRWSLGHPFIAPEPIIARQAMVAALARLGEGLLQDLRTSLQGFPDLERLLTRLLSGKITPQELGRMREGLEQVGRVLDLLNVAGQTQPGAAFTQFCTDARLHIEPLIMLQRALQDNPGALGDGNHVFAPSFDAVLDSHTTLSQNGQAAVDRYQEELRQATRINSLKIKPHKTYGLLIEVTKTHTNKIPDYFIRRQTMVNCERFTTIDLKDLEQALSDAQAEAIAREAELYAALLSEVARYQEALVTIAQALAQLDLIQCFLLSGQQGQYCRPNLTSGGEQIRLRAVRHPVVESFVGRHAFIPNDISIDAAGTLGAKQLLITGPNMAGKSTIMRTVAISALLAQVGAMVPAESADLPIFDQIFTRVGASDDLTLGMSTFMLEMSETADILRNATPESLVILDEVGRGTSTEDGLAVASAVLEDLSARIGCWTLFATHFHELVPFAQHLPTVQIAQTEVKPTADGIAFTHRLIPGASGSSYGIEVAKLAGLPGNVIARAQDLLPRTGGQPQPLSAAPPLKMRARKPIPATILPGLFGD